jgi:hypothetical protein
VASLADDYGVKGKAAKAPISTHPAFPFIVALWFAALLGMGSLVVPVALIEQIAVSTGLASIVPATAPPLGITARALIALAFTGIGALTGLLIARQIAKAHMPKPSRRYPASMHRPIDAHAELGAEGLDGFAPQVQPKGRRALAIELDHGPSELLDFAPLPGKRIESGTSALEMLDLDAREFLPDAWVSHAASDLTQDDELELTEADLAVLADFRQPLAAVEAVPGFQTFADDSGDRTVDDLPPFTMPQRSPRPSIRQEFRAPPEEVLAPSWSADEDEDWVEEDSVEDIAPEPMPEPAAPEPMNFSPPSLARFDAPTASADEPLVEAEDAAPMFENHTQFAIPQAAPTNDTGLDDSGLDDLGLVQLAQRLGNSIERRRELQAARAQLAAVPAAAPLAPLDADVAAAAPDEAAEAMAAYFAQPAAAAPVAAPEFAADLEPAAADFSAPAPRQMFEPVADAAAPTSAYRPLAGFTGFDDEDEDDEIGELAASFSLPLRRQPQAPAPFAPPAAPFAVAPVEQAAAEVEPDYGSLLALRNPFHERTEVFVRIEDEPESTDAVGQTAVVFPAEAPAPSAQVAQFAPAPAAAPLDNEENERALREALLSLQRMSGAA